MLTRQFPHANLTRESERGRQSNEKAFTMSSDAKNQVDARVHAKAHFAMTDNDAKRTFGSLWNETLVPGTVVEVETDTSGKRASVFLKVRWDLPGGQRVKRVNLRSCTAGEIQSTGITAQEQAQTSPVASASFQADQNGGSRQLPEATYSGTPPAPAPAPDPLLQNLTSWNAHGVDRKQRDVLKLVGGAVARRMWEMRTVGGESIVEGGDSGARAPRRRQFDYSMAVFPQSHLVQMVQLTSKALQEKGKGGISPGELLKVFGVLIPGTCYKLGKRSDL
jgi:hypothetical protein